MSGEAQPDAARSIALIGAPIEVGTSEPGALMGPAALRTAGLVRALAELGHAIADRGDVVPDGPAGTRGLEGVAAWTRAVSRAVGDALDAGALPLTAGGDHSLSLGSVDGVMRHCARRGQPVFVLWLDAHADFNTSATSPSGNVHGMPLAALCGEPGFPSLFAEPAPVVTPAATSVRTPTRRDDRRARTNRRPAAQPTAPTITRAQEYDFIRADLRRLLITAAVVMVLMLALLFVIEG